ncbi:peptidase M64 [bacterium (candidate division B38) B3_B38]|nr:MAG: peptidase M64 [bacterium (candidate division B38) B3_B38]
MKRVIFSLTLVLLCASLVWGQGSVPFGEYFEEKTLRIDFYHTGTKTEDIISLDAIYEEPIWAGSLTELIDTTNLGKHLVRVFDLATNQLIYSRGFCSLFAEWQTTDEAARGFRRTFHESVLIPYPRAPVQVVIASRDRENLFREVFTMAIDPASYHIKRIQRQQGRKATAVEHNGPPSVKYDLLFLGDGYRAEDSEKFRSDVARYVEHLFSLSPYKERRQDFNLWSVEVISAESGISQPRQGVYRDTALGCSFNAFDLPRYVLTLDNRAMRDIASIAPYDGIIILVNSERYGGGGIFRLYAISTVDHADSPHVVVHELGHALAGLGDEYYQSEVAYSEFYPPDVEPWEPNITICQERKMLKWRDLVDRLTPIPTPEKQEFVDAVGCFEGAGYAAKGLFRPAMRCIMFSKKSTAFCPVCRRAIERIIDLYSR